MMSDENKKKLEEEDIKEIMDVIKNSYKFLMIERIVDIDGEV